jgi:hypothetical protein
VYRRVGPFFNLEELKEPDPHHASENGPFYKIRSAKQERVKIKAEALLITNNMKASELDKIKADLIKYAGTIFSPLLAISQRPSSRSFRSTRKNGVQSFGV